MARTAFSRSGGDTASFPVTTRVLTPGGQRPIGTLTRGAPVLSYDAGRGRLVLAQVLRVVTVDEAAARVWTLALDGGAPVLEAAGRQSFLTARGWVEARHLHLGDRIRRIDADGQAQIATLTGLSPALRFPPTFRLVTSGPCTFIADGVVTHNFTVLRGLRAGLANLRYGLERHPEWAGAPLPTGQMS